MQDANLTQPSPLERMIQQQIMDRGIRDERVLAALRSVPREKFFPDDSRKHAFADRSTSIGHGQTISQPYMVALMTQRLEVQPQHRVLEIGTGSGYQTAVLAKLAGEVWTLERLKPLLDEAFERLQAMSIRNVHYRFGDGTLGWPEAAPFDRILITAGAPQLPRDLLLNQLADGGVAVIPIGPRDEQMLIAIHRHGDKLKPTNICPCRFVKLIGKEGWNQE
ncbi:MAG TPA: protein-L-isoaspartate(D-aspartate) O-methyltransferase [Tepidisphaeraceae bacterium]|jgi:protein-L-isoaspartate(D-aspartate) O-methyltransferase|nr:protein-L-isoaspartate(D-aspartate) O-methyltransferase [Tepidisphaeraceae bacterium]